MLQLSRATLTLSPSAAYFASNNDSLLVSWATIILSIYQPLISLHAMIHYYSHGQQSVSLHQLLISLHAMIHYYSYGQQSLSLHQPLISLHTMIQFHSHGQQSLSIHQPRISLQAMIHFHSQFSRLLILLHSPIYQQKTLVSFPHLPRKFKRLPHYSM